MAAVISPQRDIAQLLHVAQGGDRDATARLLIVVRPLVLRYCRARLPQWQHRMYTPEDVAQEVCLAVVSALPRYRYGAEAFLPFVYGIAAHKLSDVQRHIARDRSDPIGELPDRADDAIGPAEALVRTELRDAIATRLNRLSARAREVVVMRLILGFTVPQAAAALGTSPGAVRVMQHRALVDLRQGLRHGM